MSIVKKHPPSVGCLSFLQPRFLSWNLSRTNRLTWFLVLARYPHAPAQWVCSIHLLRFDCPCGFRPHGSGQVLSPDDLETYRSPSLLPIQSMGLDVMVGVVQLLRGLRKGQNTHVVDSLYGLNGTRTVGNQSLGLPGRLIRSKHSFVEAHGLGRMTSDLMRSSRRFPLSGGLAVRSLCVMGS